jgi:hypothetical protein
MVELSGLYSVFGKLKTFAFYTGGLFIIGMLLIAVINSMFFGFSTGNWNPLMDNTIGQVIASETYIKNAMTELSSNTGLKFDQAEFLKSKIFRNLIYMGIFIIIIFKILKWVINLTVSEADMTGGMKILITGGLLLLTILTFSVSEFVYNRYALDLEFSESLPFVGISSIYTHRDAFRNYGSLTEGLFSMGIEGYSNKDNRTKSITNNVSASQINTITMLTTY